MEDDHIPPELLALIENVTAKRAKTVLDHVRLHGYITNVDLNQIYGYDHPPRAIRDVRELGIPLESFKIPGPDGHKITAYRFPTNLKIEESKAGGRRIFPKQFKQSLLARDGEQCKLCGGKFSGRLLQIDHKVPYEVSGDKSGALNPEEFMLVCGSCNRTKSWECEHCDNWKNHKLISICRTCIFASPDSYQHIATRQKRRLTFNWNENEIEDYDSLIDEANEAGLYLDDYVKSVLKRRKRRNFLEDDQWDPGTDIS
jgi:5-methylcytosine-specific restriction endonuclease McrA